MDNKKIGSFIAKQRKIIGLNQKQLAEKIQVTDKAISRWETGKGMPEVSLLQPLANALGVSVGELLNGEIIENASIVNETDKIIVNTLKNSKRKSKIAIALTVVIFILIGIVSFLWVNNTEKKMITNVKTEVYEIYDENQSSCIGVTFDFDSVKSVDGYEFIAYFDDGNGSIREASKKSYSAENTCFYFATQEGPKQIRVRAYDDVEEEKKYSDWYTVYESDIVDFDNLQRVSSNEWSTINENNVEFDPYNM